MNASSNEGDPYAKIEDFLATERGRKFRELYKSVKDNGPFNKAFDEFVTAIEQQGDAIEIEKGFLYEIRRSITQSSTAGPQSGGADYHKILNIIERIENQLRIHRIDKILEHESPEIDPDMEFTVKEIKKRFGVDSSTLERWWQDGKPTAGLPTMVTRKEKGRIRIKYRDLKPFLDAWEPRKK